MVIWGIPYFTDGTESDMTKRVRSLGEELRAKLPSGVELHFQDETLSTFEAEERMKNDPRFNFQVDLKKLTRSQHPLLLNHSFRIINKLE